MAYKTKRFYRNNFGLPGVVYILENEGLRDGWIKIGCSTRSGKVRALELNEDAGTGTPGSFKCIYQHKTVDCGRAEQEVFKILAKFRRGKKGQEFFEVSLDLAKNTIEKTCRQFDNIFVQKPNSPAKVTLNSDRQNYRQPINRKPVNRNKTAAKILPAISNKTNKRAGIINNMENKFCDKCGNSVMASMRLCPQCGNKSFASSAPATPSVNSISRNIKNKIIQNENVIAADHFRRLIAYIIDLVIVYASAFILGFLFGATLGKLLGHDNIKTIAGLFGIILTFVYFSYFHSSSSQATPGMKFMNLIIRSSINGSKLSGGQALLRFLCHNVLALSGVFIWLIGESKGSASDSIIVIAALAPILITLTVFFNEKRQTLYDIICNTEIIKE